MIWKMLNTLQNFEWRREKSQTGLAVIREAKPRAHKPLYAAKTLCLPLLVRWYGTTLRSFLSLFWAWSPTKCSITSFQSIVIDGNGILWCWTHQHCKSMPKLSPKEGHHCRTVLVLLMEQLGLLRSLIIIRELSITLVKDCMLSSFSL